MPTPPPALLKPRKSPVQARSTASVDAILEATVQVLRDIGKQRLTTTRVAARAGVSVGTLYQYFLNKSSLLQAAMRHHLDDITETVERVCREQVGQPLPQMATTLITAFLAAKIKDPKTSVALYALSADLDGARIAREVGDRCRHAIAAMLETAREPLTKDPQLVASVLQSAMAGVSRRLVEESHPEQHLDSLRDELILLATTYLQACTAKPSEHIAPGIMPAEHTLSVVIPSEAQRGRGTRFSTANDRTTSTTHHAGAPQWT